MAIKKVEFCLKEKNPPRAQIFRYFRIENRNNNSVWSFKMWYTASTDMFYFRWEREIQNWKCR